MLLAGIRTTVVGLLASNGESPIGIANREVIYLIPIGCIDRRPNLVPRPNLILGPNLIPGPLAGPGARASAYGTAYKLLFPIGYGT